MALAIILHGISMARDRHSHLVGLRLDLQIAFGLRNCIVVSLRVPIQRVVERILGRAYVRNRTGHIVARAFAVHEFVAAHRHGAVRQRRAVIHLAVRRGGQRYITLLDRQAAVPNNTKVDIIVLTGCNKVLFVQMHVVCISICTRRKSFLVCR